MKSEIARRISLSPATLPYRKDVLAFIAKAKAEGRLIVLATAANQDQARFIAAHVGCFDKVFASDAEHNLKAGHKADFLATQFGVGGFDYMGDSRADFPVWAKARQAIVVGRSEAFRESVSAVNSHAIAVAPSQRKPGTWLKLIRIHQWAKNLIIFVPLITSHQVFNPSALIASITAFFSLSFIASATYIGNDLFDLEHDRIHKRKCFRPLAAGDIGIPTGVVVAAIFLLVGLVLAFLLTPLFILTVAIYVALTLAYSSVIKKMMLADTIVLAGLYTLRLLAGHAVTGIPLSVWLLAFAIFIFFSLALAKRFVEVQELTATNAQISGRGYRAADLPAIGALGISSGVISVLVLILYISSPEVRVLYETPFLLMLLSPLFLYWVGRIWLLAHRSELHEDPVLFAVKDKVSYFIGLLALGVIALSAIYR